MKKVICVVVIVLAAAYVALSLAFSSWNPARWIKHDQTDEPDTTQPKDEPPKDEPHIHAFSSEWNSDKDLHWHSCDCGVIKYIAAHDFEAGVCSVCGYVVSEEACNHVPGEQEVNDRGHYHLCQVCGKMLDFSDHDYINQGYSLVCSICGKRVIPA